MLLERITLRSFTPINVLGQVKLSFLPDSPVNKFDDDSVQVQGTVQVLEAANFDSVRHAFHLHVTIPFIAHLLVKVESALNKLALLNAFSDDRLVLDVFLIELFNHGDCRPTDEKVFFSESRHCRLLLSRLFI